MSEKISRRQMILGLGATSLLGAVTRSQTRPEKNKHLLLDTRVAERVEGARLTIGRVEKDARNPLFAEDKPWEVRFDNLYANVLFDPSDKLYKCWYSPFIADEAVSTTPRSERATVRYRALQREMGVCYAASQDGINWRKPELGIIEFNGSRNNNLVARRTHGAGVWRDGRDPDLDRRYKMFFNDEKKRMGVMFSRDGLRWQGRAEFDEMQAVGDTHNNAFWSPDREAYVAITRLWDRPLRQRLVGRSESRDFRNWTKAVEILRALPGELHRQTYAMTVFRHADLYLGLLMIFNTITDTVDCELAWSADSENWKRVCPGSPLIPLGPPGAYDSGCVYGAATPIFLQNEIRLYYGGSNGPHTNWRDGFFCLARLRPDGFAGMEPVTKQAAGAVTTRPALCAGRELRVSADAQGGSLRVGVLGAEGLSLDRCRPVTANVTDGIVRWRGGDFARLEGRTVRLQFELRSARLYSFRFV